MTVNEQFNDLRLDLADEGWRTNISATVHQHPETRMPFYQAHLVSLKSNYWNGVLQKEDTPTFEATAGNSEDIIPLLTLLSKLKSDTVQANLGYIPKLTLTLPKDTNISKAGVIDPDFNFDKADTAQIQEYMMTLGWGYADSINARRNNDKHYRHVSFERYDWHGSLLGAATTFWHLAPANILWDVTVRRLAQITLKAWKDFPDSVPHQTVDGSIKEDVFKTKIFRKQI